jgi:hypothetical protein
MGYHPSGANFCPVVLWVHQLPSVYPAKSHHYRYHLTLGQQLSISAPNLNCTPSTIPHWLLLHRGLLLLYLRFSPVLEEILRSYLKACTLGTQTLRSMSELPKLNMGYNQFVGSHSRLSGCPVDTFILETPRGRSSARRVLACIT